MPDWLVWHIFLLKNPMLLNDATITQLANAGMISPFIPELIRQVYGEPQISYGLSSFGYDLRLSPNDFRIFRHVPGVIVNPKNFSPANLESSTLFEDHFGAYFILPAHSYGLGVALERLDIPDNITAICMGKSTYARCGIIANITPAESGWRGHLTLEFSNSSSADCRIYANEGVVQLLFLEGEKCNTSYAKRLGKYQDQGESVVLAKV